MQLTSWVVDLICAASLFFIPEKIEKKRELEHYYLLPLETKNHIKSMFVGLIQKEAKYTSFKKIFANYSIRINNCCPELGTRECTIAYDEGCPGDRYVRSILCPQNSRFHSCSEQHYHLCVGRCGMGILSTLPDFDQRRVSLLTFKNNIIKAYYKRDNGRYDLQEWYLGIEPIINKLSCVQLALVYNSFERAQNSETTLLSFLYNNLLPFNRNES